MNNHEDLILQAIDAAAKTNKSMYLESLSELDDHWREVEILLKATSVVIIERLIESVENFDLDYVEAIAATTVSRWTENLNLLPDLIEITIHSLSPGYDGVANEHFAKIPVNIWAYHVLALLGYLTHGWTHEDRLRLIEQAHKVISHTETKRSE